MLLSLLWLLGSLLLIFFGFSTYRANSTGTAGRKSAFIFMLAALIAGAYLRFSVLDFGFPEFYHPDETTKSRVLTRMAKAGTWDPNYFLHPSGLLYSAKLVAKLFKAVGIYSEDEPHRYVLAGRFVSAAAGTIAIYLIYLIALELSSRRKELIAVLAAISVAFSPLHLCCSRYFKEDSLFTTFMLLVLLLSLKALKSQNTLHYIFAGLASGLCAGSKYTGGIAILLPVFTLLVSNIDFPGWFRPNKDGSNISSRSKIIVQLVGMFIAAAVAFAFTTPYAILNFDGFIKGVLFERSHVLGGHGGIAISAWSQLWTYHLSRSLPRGMTEVLLALSLLGVGAALKRRGLDDLLLLFGCALFYAAAEYVKAKPMPQPDRYVLPALLILALFASRYLAELKVFKVSLLGALLVGSIIIINGIYETRLIRPDTREEMTSWVEKNIPPNSKIVLAGLPYYAPRLNQHGYNLRILSPELARNRLSVEKLAASNHEYLLVTSLSYERYFSQPFADQAMRERFESYEKVFPLVHEERKAKGSYGFHNPTLKLFRLR